MKISNQPLTVSFSNRLDKIESSGTRKISYADIKHLKNEVSNCIKNKNLISYQDHIDILKTATKLETILSKQNSARHNDKITKLGDVLNTLPKLESPGYKTYQKLKICKDNLNLNLSKLKTEKTQLEATKREIKRTLENEKNSGSQLAKECLNMNIFQLRDRLVKETKDYGTTIRTTEMVRHHEWSDLKPVTHSKTIYTDKEKIWLGLKNKAIQGCEQQTVAENREKRVQHFENKACEIAKTFGLKSTWNDAYGLNTLKKL